MVEAPPKARSPEVRRYLGKLGSEESVSIAAPAQTKKGRRMVPRGTAGLRAPAGGGGASAKSVEAKNNVRDRVRSEREERRQRVWDKLDAAKRHADERAPRLRTFQPTRLDDDFEDEY